MAVYPDSDKLGAWSGGDEWGIFPRSAAVDYWEGEEPPDAPSGDG